MSSIIISLIFICWT